MSSPQPFLQSSPLSTGAGTRRKSQFTFKHLHQLSLSSTTCPLRVIAHIDLDAFYAQCEMVRLGVPLDKPLAVQQWQGLIAINYPARTFGLSRHITSTEALKLCPELILQHVATWKEGDEKWAYHEDAYKHIATHKVSLDPYRMESRKILATIKESLPPAPMQKVEKASIDEVFLDLSAQVHSIMLERYPELQGPPPYDDLTEHLPRPPTTALDWHTDALVDLDASETEDDDPDWDDIAMLTGSEIVRSIRATIFEKLKYTCSAGIARNKMLAKLGSGHKKPNQQTVIRNRAVQHFLSEFKFTKIRNLGGKLGDEVVAMFNTDTVKDLLGIPLERLQKLGDDTGSWLHSTIRGEDNSEVNPRTQIKSMLSAKSFRPSINTFDQAVRWLRIFVADVFSRCVEEGVLENKRKPKTIHLHHRHGAQTRSKSASIPQGKTLDENILFDLGKTLLAQIVADGRAWPCANLSLSVGGFEDGVTGNKGIDGFLVRGEEARAMLESERRTTDSPLDERDAQLSSKRRKLDIGGIQKFFVPRDHSRGESDSGFSPPTEHEESKRESEPDPDAPSLEPTEMASKNVRDRFAICNNEDTVPPDIPPPSAQPQSPSQIHQLGSPELHQQILDTYFCTRCATHLPLIQQAEHEDWHFAKDLAKELQTEERQSDNRSNSSSSRRSPVISKPMGRGRGRPPGNASSNTHRGGGVERGQQKLAFGKG